MERLELNKNDPKISQFVRGYKGRKPIKVQATTSFHVSDYWSEGSRDYTSFIDLNTGSHLSYEQVGFVKQTQSNPFNLPIGEVALRPGLVVVVNSVFCGKPMPPRLYCHLSDFDKFK